MSDADIRATATDAAATLARLLPGDLAELRRMAPHNPGPWFWRLASRHGATIGRREDDWVHILRILAILSPRGDPEKRPRLHNPDRHLGAVLCDGGDPAWPRASLGKPRPAYSELRFARLLEAGRSQRSTLLTRAARSLARSMPPGGGVDVGDIAFAALYPDSAEVNNGLARSYYSRLDGATQRADNQEGDKQ